MPNLAIQHLLLNMLQYWDFSKENISERETVLAGGSRRERERDSLCILSDNIKKEIGILSG